MAESVSGFDDFFETATGERPYPYQRKLAESRIVSRIISVPTGAGKTAAVILAWLYQRYRSPETTPRRLVYCLPMRVLVEQTRDLASQWVSRIEKIWPQAGVGVYTLMGGEVEEGWEVFPERPAILVGTQDMLLSRALNRGYAMSRYKWPVHFGLLNNDCLWVCDEVQLMGSGLATATQMEAFRSSFGAYGPVATWWMSATLRRDWLETVDFKRFCGSVANESLDPEKDLTHPVLSRRFNAAKPLAEMNQLNPETVRQHHKPGTLTLVVMNTVHGAQELCREFKAANAGSKKRKRTEATAATQPPELLLVHSRFRPVERRQRLCRLLIADSTLRGRDVEMPAEDRGWVERVKAVGLIAITTQVLEAGVDVSAECLITQLAPWSNLVQRFGRSNRDGLQSGARVFWADLPDKEALPYTQKQLQESRKRLRDLKDVGIVALANLEATGDKPAPVIRRHDVYGLFSIEPDLAGGFTDVSPFVRDLKEDTSVYVFWRDEVRADEPAPAPEELCAVAFYNLAEFLKGNKTTALEWNEETEEWEPRKAYDIRPGMTLLLKVAQGGYSELFGWTGVPDDKPAPLMISRSPTDAEARDHASESTWCSLRDHLRDALSASRDLIERLGMVGTPEGESVAQAGFWHDIGKAHDRWQKAIPSSDDSSVGPAAGETLWAKFPRVAGRTFRPGMRHEAASALCGWRKWQRGDEGWTALAVYLVASHHGKVRTVLRSRMGGTGDVFGIEVGDNLPRVEGWLDAGIALDLECRAIGSSGIWDDGEGAFIVMGPSWAGMMAELLGPALLQDPEPKNAIPIMEPRGLGPFRLAYLEALLASTDVRASRLAGERGKA